MASPQIENGYTRIAHEILEALARHPLPGRHRRILDLVLRESYGRNRKEALLSLRDFSQRTGISKPHCCSLLRDLGLLRLVTGIRVTKDGNHHKTAWSFQKDYSRWGVPPIGTVPKNGNGSVPKEGNGSRTRAKKREKRNTTAQPEVAVLVDEFYQGLLAKLGEKPVGFPGAMLAANLKRTLHNFPAAEIRRRMGNWFASTDPFIVQSGWAPGLFFKRFNTLAIGPLAGIANGKPPRNLVDEGWAVPA